MKVRCDGNNLVATKQCRSISLKMSSKFGSKFCLAAANLQKADQILKTVDNDSIWRVCILLM